MVGSSYKREGFLKHSSRILQVYHTSLSPMLSNPLEPVEGWEGGCNSINVKQ